MGGVVFCNYSDENNIQTVISNSRFINNNSCIFHTGELTVVDCYFEVNDEFKHEEIDVNNVFGIYQTSGELKFNNNEVYFDLTNAPNIRHHAKSRIVPAQSHSLTFYLSLLITPSIKSNSPTSFTPVISTAVCLTCIVLVPAPPIAVMLMTSA